MIRSHRNFATFVCRASALLALLWTPALVLADDAKEEPKEKIEAVKLASITLGGSLSESPAAPGLFGDIEENLPKLLARLEKAAGDKAISGVVLRFRGPAIGRGRINEVRAAIAEVRAAGKKVYALVDSGEVADYLVAGACDQIIMPPSGVLTIPGVRAEVAFYKGTLDKLGIEADFIHVGAYKGAAEPYTRNSMSPEVRQNLTTLIDDLYDQLVTTVAADRKLDAGKVKDLIDQGLFTAKQALDAGLIDKIAYDDEFRAELTKTLAADKLELVKNYGKKKIDADFSGPAGMIKLMQMMAGVPPTKSKGNGKKIAIIYAVGAIQSGKSASGALGGSMIGSDTIVAALRKADSDEHVAAIVLRIDSPGGSALASDLIWREEIELKKPLVASMGDVAASGGYYIAMGADKIYAEPGTVTGSIGVVGGKMALKGLFDKVGVTTEVLSRGRNSSMLDPTSRFSETERKALQGMMNEIYQQFTGKAATGRKMEPAAIEKLAGGQVWTGRMAKNNGLVDELGTLKDAIAAAKTLAGLKPEDKTDTLILPEPKNFFELLGGDSGDEEVSFSLPLGVISKDLAPHAAQAEILYRLFQQPAATIMPFQLNIR